MNSFNEVFNRIHTERFMKREFATLRPEGKRWQEEEAINMYQWMVFDKTGALLVGIGRRCDVQILDKLEPITTSACVPVIDCLTSFCEMSHEESSAVKKATRHFAIDEIVSAKQKWKDVKSSCKSPGWACSMSFELLVDGFFVWIYWNLLESSLFVPRSYLVTSKPNNLGVN